METSTIVTQKINLIEGEFSASEVKDVITSLIDEKINFHKLQRLSWCEGDHGADTAFPDGRIGELQREKEIAREFINGLRGQGKRFKMEGVVRITMLD